MVSENLSLGIKYSTYWVEHSFPIKNEFYYLLNLDHIRLVHGVFIYHLNNSLKLYHLFQCIMVILLFSYILIPVILKLIIFSMHFGLNQFYHSMVNLYEFDIYLFLLIIGDQLSDIAPPPPHRI